MQIFKDIQNLSSLIYLINKKDYTALSELNRVYKIIFGVSINEGCGNCNIKAYHRLINLTQEDIKEMENQNFKIKKDVLIEWPKGTFYSSESGINDRTAKEYLKTFPQLANNFEIIPTPKEVKK